MFKGLKYKPTLSVFKAFALTASLGLLAGCATQPPPANTHSNICKIIEHDRNWYIAAKKSEKKWGTPVATLKAFVHQESRFVHNARPPGTMR